MIVRVIDEPAFVVEVQRTGVGDIIIWNQGGDDDSLTLRQSDAVKLADAIKELCE